MKKNNLICQKIKVFYIFADKKYTSGDEKTALIKTSAFARGEFLKKAEDSELWRYNRKKYWENFYETDTRNSLSDMKTILDKWENFNAAVSSKDMYKIFKCIGYGVPG